MKRPMHRKLLVIIGTIAALLSAASGQPAPPGNKPDVTLGSTPDTVGWGYISSGAPPVLRMKSGTTVRIYTMSHEGLPPMPTRSLTCRHLFWARDVGRAFGDVP